MSRYLNSPQRDSLPPHNLRGLSLPRPAVSHQLLLSLQRSNQRHPLPWCLCVTAGSYCTHERLLVAVCRGWEAHWTQHSGSCKMVTKPSIWTAKGKKENIRGSFIRGYKRLVDGLIAGTAQLLKSRIRHRDAGTRCEVAKGRSKWHQLLNTATKRGKKSIRQQRRNCKKCCKGTWGWSKKNGRNARRGLKEMQGRWIALGMHRADGTRHA